MAARTVKINTDFICQNCQTHNPPAEKTCRNHCYHCLQSLHVDAQIPGDRQSRCHGLMTPVNIKYDSKKGWMILHRCQKCHKQIWNKTAPDDNLDLIIKLQQQSSLN